MKGKSTQNQIASYLVQVVIGLRDKENKQQSIQLLGCGQAIRHTILVAEIIRQELNDFIQYQNQRVNHRKLIITLIINSNNFNFSIGNQNYIDNESNLK